MGKRQYFVVWDITDQTRVKAYGSRHEAFERFKELTENPDVFRVEMQMASGYVLHSFERP